MDLYQLRRAFAYLLLATFVISTSVGAFTYDTSAGFATLGITSGIAAYLLGAEESA